MKAPIFSLKKIVKYSLILILVFSFILSLYQFIRVKQENFRLTQQLENERMRNDDFYGQIEELSYIIENACSKIDKYDIFNAISDFTKMQHKKLDKNSIQYFNVSKVKPQKTNVIYGYHHELVFYFDNNGKLKRVEYPKYNPLFRRID